MNADLNDVGAEMMTLGALIIAPELIPAIRQILPDAACFWDERHQTIFKSVVSLHIETGTADSALLSRQMANDGVLEAVGGESYLLEILQSPVSTRPENVEQYARIVAEKAQRRRILAAAAETINAVNRGEPTGVVAGALEEVSTAVEEVCAVKVPNGSEPALTCMADVTARQILWLWQNKIPLGRITLLVGVPGAGKSFVMIFIAALVSRGGQWPDGTACPAGPVILICPEDDAGDTQRNRLDAHGADVRQIHLLSGVRWANEDGGTREVFFTLENLAALEEAIKRVHPLRLIIDPVGSVLGGDTDAHRDNEVRAVLAPVAKLAEQYGVAVLIVAHRRKSFGTHADSLALGSVAFTGIPRVVHHLSRDPENKARRLFLPGKNNLAAEGDGLAFTIGGDPPRIWWESEPVKMDADEGLAAENSGGAERPGPEPVARDSAADWLRALLAGGERAVADIQSDAKEAGLAWRTVQRAADGLNVIRNKGGFGAGWRWLLDPHVGDVAIRATEDAKPPKEKELGILASSQNTKENDDIYRSLAEESQVFSLGGQLGTLARGQDAGMRTPNIR